MPAETNYWNYGIRFNNRKMAGSGKLLRHYIVYRLITFSGFLVRRLPVHVALSLGEHAADVVYHLVKRRREITMSNLQAALGNEKNQRELKSIARQSYHNLGKSFVEFLRFPLLTRENLWQMVTMHGRENLDRAAEISDYFIVFVPHSGNHELVGLSCSTLIPKSAAIAFPLKNPYLNEMTNKYRRMFGLELITPSPCLAPPECGAWRFGGVYHALRQFLDILRVHLYAERVAL